MLRSNYSQYDVQEQHKVTKSCNVSNNVKKEKIEDPLKLKILIYKNNKKPTPKLVTNFFQADATINTSNDLLEKEKKIVYLNYLRVKQRHN